jgi:hypothetical protein
MDFNIHIRLKQFLDKKMLEWLENARKNKNPPLKDVLSDIRQGNNLSGFIFEKEEKRRYNDNVHYMYTKSEEKIEIDCGISDAKKRSRTSPSCISLQIGDVRSPSYYINDYPNLVYQVFEHSGEIEKEFFALKAQLEKDAKIAKIAQNSIKEWLKVICKDIHRPYYITEEAWKITLSVKMKYGTKLDIPIYNRRFQKIIPEILNTIQQYEELMNNTKIKINVSNNVVGQKWLNDNKDENGSKN